jgi:16S rRNA (cytidine1402-2'-O)-methyltransferase
MTVFMNTLYVIATPIGNLEDISLRALRILKEVDLIATEDTRKTKRLLNHYQITTPMTSYYEHNKMTKLNYIISKIEAGDVALVSEAGMPGISDPGYELVVTALKNNIKVVPIPGASAVTTALSVSGLATDRFTFLGFLAARTAARKHILVSVANEPGTLIILEAPHRLKASLKDILEILGERRVAVCRELTKMYEEIFHGTISQAIEHFAAPKGEFTLVIEGKKNEEKPEMTNDVEKQLHTLRLKGVPAKEAIARIAAETGLSKRELYRTWLKQV